MTEEQQMDEIADAIDKWCPRTFNHEPLASRAIRAFLNARACVADLRRARRGDAPIRPLDSYPEDNI